MTVVDANPLEVPVTLIGHPFAPIGRGEDLRTAYRAFRSVGVNADVVNVYDGSSDDRRLVAEFGGALQGRSGGGVDLFCLNGDEIEAALAHLGPRLEPSRRRIIFPTWELPVYPAAWVPQLERFDEIWAPSAFVRDAIAPAVSKPVTVIPEPTGVSLDRFLGRRYFGIPEGAYTFLFAFDLRSYHQRKNPVAVLDAFAGLVAARPAADVVLVVKMAGGDVRPDAADAILQRLRERNSKLGLGRLVIVEQQLTDSETKSLVRCCDCFVSLHRSEGFGRFLAEAMFLGRPVIATGWSGNMEFMNHDVACLVDCGFVPVGDGEYPFWQDQRWAAPSVSEATGFMTRFVDDPELGRQLGERASRHIRTHFSYRAIGLRYLKRLAATVA